MMRIFRRLFGAGVLLIGSLIAINMFVVLTGWSDVMEPDYADYDVGLVLGASVTSDGLLSPVLQERVDAALGAYNDGIISKILVSGYDKNDDHLEAISMADYLLDSGVPDDDIWVDGNGYDTRASMIKAKQEFEVDRVIVFTQRYHLWRSMMYARASDMDAVGYAVDTHGLSLRDFGTTREILARVKSFVEVMISG